MEARQSGEEEKTGIESAQSVRGIQMRKYYILWSAICERGQPSIRRRYSDETMGHRVGIYANEMDSTDYSGWPGGLNRERECWLVILMCSWFHICDIYFMRWLYKIKCHIPFGYILDSEYRVSDEQLYRLLFFSDDILDNKFKRIYAPYFLEN